MTALLPSTTASERMTIALSDGARRWLRPGAGAPRPRRALRAGVPARAARLSQSGPALTFDREIAFGRRHTGAFTGLRTACSVAAGGSPSRGQAGAVPDRPPARGGRGRALRLFAAVGSGRRRCTQWTRSTTAAEYGFAAGPGQRGSARDADADPDNSSAAGDAPPQAVAGRRLARLRRRLDTGNRAACARPRVKAKPARASPKPPGTMARPRPGGVPCRAMCATMSASTTRERDEARAQGFAAWGQHEPPPVPPQGANAPAGGSQRRDPQGVGHHERHPKQRQRACHVDGWPMTLAALDGVVALEVRGLSVSLYARQLRRFARRRLRPAWTPQRHAAAS